MWCIYYTCERCYINCNCVFGPQLQTDMHCIGNLGPQLQNEANCNADPYCEFTKSIGAEIDTIATGDVGASGAYVTNTSYPPNTAY